MSQADSIARVKGKTSTADPESLYDILWGKVPDRISDLRELVQRQNSRWMYMKIL